MAYEWIREYCLSKKGATTDYQAAWEATRYHLGGKMFAMQGGDKTGRAIFTMKLEPEFGSLLRSAYADIVPGYYMNKEHWNSLYLEGKVPDDVVRDMIDRSYLCVWNGLTKKLRDAIGASNI